MEFVASNDIKVHPMALLHFDRLEDQEAKRAVPLFERCSHYNHQIKW
jgi:hypothetical protein